MTNIQMYDRHDYRRYFDNVYNLDDEHEIYRVFFKGELVWSKPIPPKIREESAMIGGNMNCVVEGEPFALVTVYMYNDNDKFINDNVRLDSDGFGYILLYTIQLNPTTNLKLKAVWHKDNNHTYTSDIVSIKI